MLQKLCLFEAFFLTEFYTNSAPPFFQFKFYTGPFAGRNAMPISPRITLKKGGSRNGFLSEK